jgi:hypothetical protein
VVHDKGNISPCGVLWKYKIAIKKLAHLYRPHPALVNVYISVSGLLKFLRANIPLLSHQNVAAKTTVQGHLKFLFLDDAG